MKIYDLLHENKKQIERIINDNLFFNPKLFNSCVNLDTKTDNEVIFVVVEPMEDASYYKMANAEYDLEELLGIKIELVSKGGLKGEEGEKVLNTLVDF